jgi:hypothetical protein
VISFYLSSVNLQNLKAADRVFSKVLALEDSDRSQSLIYATLRKAKYSKEITKLF